MSEKGKTGKQVMPNNFDAHSDEKFHEVLKIAQNSLYSINFDKFNCETKRKIYFAGPWFDNRANDLYDTCYKICSFFKNSYEFYFPREEVNNFPIEAFKKNVNNIKDCDIIIALVSRKDVGTSWEIGMGYALNKKIYLLGYDESTFLSHTNVMLAFTGKCLTIDKLTKFLTNKIDESDFVKIKNEWDGIE